MVGPTPEGTHYYCRCLLAKETGAGGGREKQHETGEGVRLFIHSPFIVVVLLLFCFGSCSIDRHDGQCYYYHYRPSQQYLVYSLVPRTTAVVAVVSSLTAVYYAKYRLYILLYYTYITAAAAAVRWFFFLTGT